MSVQLFSLASEYCRSFKLVDFSWMPMLFLIQGLAWIQAHVALVVDKVSCQLVREEKGKIATQEKQGFCQVQYQQSNLIGQITIHSHTLGARTVDLYLAMLYECLTSY